MLAENLAQAYSSESYMQQIQKVQKEFIDSERIV